MTRAWSTYQEAIFADVANGEGHTMVDAVAGAGKSTTIEEAIYRIPAPKSGNISVGIFAFNKDIATALQARFSKGSHRIARGVLVQASTLNSLGAKACYAARLGKLDDTKGPKLADRVTMADKAPKLREWSGFVCRVSRLAKAHLARSVEDVERVVEVQDINVPAYPDVPCYVCAVDGRNATCHVCHGEGRLPVEDYRSQVLRCLELSIAESKTWIDFQDQVWLPVAMKLGTAKFDRLFVDETQDLDSAQIALILGALKPGGRIVAVGDPRQAIYQFRGANHDAFDRVREALSAKVLPLSVTYRCARAIVAEAQTVVPHIQASPNAEEGSVRNVDTGFMDRELAKGDFVLSRTNAPLVAICLSLLRLGVPAFVQGRDVAGKLINIVKRSGRKDAGEVLQWVSQWCDKECVKLQKADPEADISRVTDVRDCIFAVAEGCDDASGIIAKVERMFGDVDPKNREACMNQRVTLSSTHKAKGLERDRVWLLRDTYLKRPSPEESNLYYVAVTRAARELFIVREKKV